MTDLYANHLSMRRAAFLCCLLFVKTSFSQLNNNPKPGPSFTRNSQILTPDSLSRFLTSGLTSEHEKVVSIFQWITEHISYNTNKNPKPYAKEYLEDDLEEDDDAVTELRPPG